MPGRTVHDKHCRLAAIHKMSAVYPIIGPMQMGCQWCNQGSVGTGEGIAASAGRPRPRLVGASWPVTFEKFARTYSSASLSVPNVIASVITADQISPVH